MKPLNEIRCFLVDMDGTFYLGDRLLPGALEFAELMRSRGVPFLFLTNNSSKTNSQYAEKLRRLGLEIDASQIFTSGEATAIYLKREKPGARLYVVGTPALESELDAHGFTRITSCWASTPPSPTPSCGSCATSSARACPTSPPTRT